MPNHKACAKHLRATAKRNTQNRAARSALRTAVKRVRGAATKAEGSAALQKAFSVIDKGAKKGLVHRNKAAGQKAKLARVVASLSD